MRSGFDLRSKGRDGLKGPLVDGELSGHAEHRCKPSPEREDRILLIRHRLVGDKASGIGFYRGRMPGACPHGRAFDADAWTS